MGDSLYAGLQIDVNKDGFINSEDWDSEQDKKILVDAITNKNNKHYKYAASKNIVAEYLTMQSENKFYGNSKKSLSERKAMRPTPGETKKQFIARGGIMGELAGESIHWNEEGGVFESKISASDQEILDKIKANK